LLAQLDAPLIERVDAPDDPLDEGDVLVEGDQLTDDPRADLGGHDRCGRLVAREDPRLDDRLTGAFGAHLVGGLAEGEGRGLREEVGQEERVHVDPAFAQRVRGVHGGDEVGRNHLGPLVNQLVEGVLTVGARLTPEDLAGLGGDR